MSEKDVIYGLKKPRCEYCAKYNGDHFDDESERYDYYSCELKNDYDHKKYGGYGSKDNEVFEDECLYPGCPTCQYKEEFIEVVVKRIGELRKDGTIKR